MSGNVVGWVFDNYPVNVPKDRTRKIVLSEVAEAANRDYEHTHPGIRSICSHWHLGRSTVTTALSELVADGWLEVTEKGGGKGKATVYRVCREKAQKLGGMSGEEPRDQDRPVSPGPDPDTARFDDPIPRDSGLPDNSFPNRSDSPGPRSPNGEPPETPTLDIDAEPRPLSFRERGRLLAVEVFDEKRPRPAGEKAFTTAISVAAALLKAGHDERAIVRAMIGAPTLSIATCEIELNRHTRRPTAQATAEAGAQLIDSAFGFTSTNGVS